MKSPAIDSMFEHLLEDLSARLKPLDFARSGSVLRIVRDGNCGLLEFQRSTKSSAHRLLFTVNVGIICGALLDPHVKQLRKVHSIDAHVRQRIGMFMHGSPDKWWEITEATDTVPLIEELAELITGNGVPFIMGLLSTTAIVSLWQSGQSPGLTDGQRLRFLARLSGVGDAPEK